MTITNEAGKKQSLSKKTVLRQRENVVTLFPLFVSLFIYSWIASVMFLMFLKGSIE